MDGQIDTFVPKKAHIVCFDSDGTIIDAMNVKHNLCHGAAFIEEWGLQDHREEVQKKWNDINLYKRSRGINRFLGLRQILCELDGKLLSADGIEHLDNWLNKTSQLSAKSLKEEIAHNDAEILKKALRFSCLTNEKVAKLKSADKPVFEGAAEMLKHASDVADIAIVSSGNMDAIKDEWEYYGILKYAEVITSLEIGSKLTCLKSIIARGYEAQNVLMVGDALTDLDCAKAAGAHFYPVLTRNESESLRELDEKYLDEFVSGNYANFEQQLVERFDKNFL